MTTLLTTDLRAPFELRHDLTRVRAGMVATSSMMVVALVVPIIFAGLAWLDWQDKLIIALASLALAILGCGLTFLGFVRLKDPVYLAIDESGQGRWRPYLRVRWLQFGLEPAILEGERLVWVTPQHSDGLIFRIKVDGEDKYGIDLPRSVLRNNQSRDTSTATAPFPRAG